MGIKVIERFVLCFCHNHPLLCSLCVCLTHQRIVKQDANTFCSEEQFNETINSEKLVVVDAYAEWCGPCKLLTPKIEEFSRKYSDVVFAKFDIEKLRGLASKLEIRAMPTLNFYKGGQKVANVMGFDPMRVEDTIKEQIFA